MINLALDGLPIHPDGISGEQAISIPWDYVSLGLSVIVKEKDLMRKKLFRFYIKGDREELLETSSHAFTFPALSPGNYELWVSYSKKNGDWSVPLRLLTVDVEPPLWRRAWFLIAMGVIAFAAIGGMIWSVMRRKERKLAWAMKEHERKFYEEKVRFMVNISHELRTPLTLIYAPLKRLLKSGKVTDKDVSRQLDGLLLQTCRMREIVDMVLDAQKSDTNGDVMDIRFYDLNDWIRSVTDDFIMEFEARRISVRFQLDASVE
ncbi:MAG: histidine kinase dimerization/phospho-acceptor domain-containing protein, partial [Parabacteroides distasonis]